MKTKITTITLLGLLTGCASTDEQAICNANTDWKTLGYETSQSGKNVRKFDSYQTQCGSNMPGDAKELFITGYTNGLKEYCMYENGYKLGQEGLQTNEICPFEMRSAFEKGYKIGSKERKEKQLNAERQQRELDRANQRKLTEAMER